MSVEAADAYEKARKLAKRETREGDTPPVLDEILDPSVPYAQERVGQKEIPLDQIVGMKNEGRVSAFGKDFLPLLKPDSEFANKWMRLYDAQIEEGLRDPIQVYEYMHQYYVEEGNKRVSVMKYLGGKTILASITRILPPRDESEKSKQYYAYLDFAHTHNIDFIHLNEAGGYARLAQLLGLPKDYKLDAEQEKQLKSEYALFERAFHEVKTEDMHLDVGDAFLLYLEIYDVENFLEKSGSELLGELRQIEDDLRAYPNKLETRLETASLDQQLKRRLLGRRQPLKAAFIYSRSPEDSFWTKMHHDGQVYVQDLMPYEIETKGYFEADDLDQELERIKEAIAWGAEVIFTTSPTMLRSSIMMAAKYPKLKILNCSLNTRTGHLRTYYARLYELQFLNGMIAGILSDTHSIGYIADYPFYGMISNINAFALGARMVDPQAKVYLDWSTTNHAMLEGEEMGNADLMYITSQEINPLIHSAKTYGLYDVKSQSYMHLAKRQYYWGEFYKQLLTSVLNGSFKQVERHGSESICYWWGLSNFMIDLVLADTLPKQTKRLVEVMKEHMAEGEFNLFSTEMIDQQGVVRNEDAHNMSLDDIADMDWLLDNVVGTVPDLDAFSKDARKLISRYGIYSLREQSHD
ncbi:BMP family ABC transporter substrate-binding protein [uncultured Dubosiella sp.]|uniref:BMP family ABC transporter substrate-binding protein n=1 Tax=uncultured Dubosiella sp. TaxID=1937011 RepID=UPI00272DADE5|nr:BMP family ABC transporter substrate-binding protein [uncultured Dubosiella sp.]